MYLSYYTRSDGEKCKNNINSINEGINFDCVLRSYNIVIFHLRLKALELRFLLFLSILFSTEKSSENFVGAKITWPCWSTGRSSASPKLPPEDVRHPRRAWARTACPAWAARRPRNWWSLCQPEHSGDRHLEMIKIQLFRTYLTKLNLKSDHLDEIGNCHTDGLNGSLEVWHGVSIFSFFV